LTLYYDESQGAQFDVKTPQDHLNEISEWFRVEAENLPIDAKHAVLNALDNRISAIVCRELALLRDAGSLPAYWGPSISDYCGWAF
jgi:hypothetical protein